MSDAGDIEYSKEICPEVVDGKTCWENGVSAKCETIMKVLITHSQRSHKAQRFSAPSLAGLPEISIV